MNRVASLGIFFSFAISLWDCQQSLIAQTAVLRSSDFSRFVDRFVANDAEVVVNLIPNEHAWEWMAANIPLFECPSGILEETYYFRWWSFRKHIQQTPDGLVLTEFLRPVSHAGRYNTIACAAGHHLAEARWLRAPALWQQYAMFWFQSGEAGGPAAHFHNFSSWLPTAIYQATLVAGDTKLCVELLDAFVQDDQQWCTERRLDNGLFWQYDVKDGMEESISGGRRQRNARPTIQSYMAANAFAISRMAAIAGRAELAAEYLAEADRRRSDLRQQLWDNQAEFFKVRLEDERFSNAREAIGFIPWMFGLAEPIHGKAWEQLDDPGGFWAPAGITTAERRHPAFRSHGVGTCEWDGAVWPFATCQTLNGMANLLRGENSTSLTRQDYLEQLLIYAKSHELDGMPYIGEYHDELSGHWLITGAKAERSRYYNHSTFADLIIHGLVGLIPREDDVVEIDPLVPAGSWGWFCLDGVRYRGHDLTILWDQAGERYGLGSGLILLVDGKETARADRLERLTAKLPN